MCEWVGVGQLRIELFLIALLRKNLEAALPSESKSARGDQLSH